MNSNYQYDYIIAGAGAAGLSLLWHLLHSPLRKSRILVIDKTFDIINDKTWCFWSRDHPFNDMIYHSWPELKVVSHGKEFSGKLTTCLYHCIRSGDYRTYILNYARQFQNIDFLEAEIIDFQYRDMYGLVSTENNQFEAKWIFQSIMSPKVYENTPADHSLIQHFIGWEISVNAKKGPFSPYSATLMDLDTEQKNGLTFYYILPFTEQRALIEYTIFSGSELNEKEYNNAIRLYLKNKFDLDNSQYRIDRKEKGIISMSDRKIPGYFNPRTLNIGTAGGTTKPTTGYSFTRSQRHSSEILKALVNNKIPKPYSGSHYRYKVYDSMLLYLLKNEQETSRKIFHELFDKNSIDLILQFLEEKTTFIQELKIFSRLSYAPFFRSIYHLKHRILELKS